MIPGGVYTEPVFISAITPGQEQQNLNPDLKASVPGHWCGYTFTLGEESSRSPSQSLCALQPAYYSNTSSI